MFAVHQMDTDSVDAVKMRSTPCYRRVMASMCCCSELTAEYAAGFLIPFHSTTSLFFLSIRRFRFSITLLSMSLSVAAPPAASTPRCMYFSRPRYVPPPPRPLMENMILKMNFVGNGALHVAFEADHTRIVLLLLAVCPDAAAVFGRHGYRAVHLAAMGSSTVVVEELLRCAPQTIAMEDHYRWTAVFKAASYGQDKVLRLLLRHWPDGAKKAGGWGPTEYSRLPMHVAATVNLGVVQALLEVWQEAAAIADDRGWIAAHHAARAGKLDVLDHLLLVYPAGICVRDPKGRTPMALLSPKLREWQPSSSSQHSNRAGASEQ